ncbi:predicted protein [Postia placenta Mad-698-R]|nr:predicted protein [Postia placenta Mad-698-R]
MSARSATPASTPSLVNRRLASLLMVLEAPLTADAALDVVEEWAQDLSPLVLAYRKALGAIRDEETELRVAAAVKQLAERASESRLGLEQDDLDALDLDDESRGIIRVIREERAHIARRRALLHDMDLDLQKMEKDALAKGGIGFVRGVVDED